MITAARQRTMLIVDDHRAFADALGAAFQAHHGAEVHTASTVEEARRFLDDGVVDVAVLDVVLESESGLDVAAMIKSEFPGVTVVMCTGQPSPDVLRRALELGVDGFALKSMPLNDVLAAVDSALSGQLAVPAALLSSALDARHGGSAGSDLTGRELEILELLAKGLSTRRIASELDLSVNTVRTHVQNMLTKLGVHSRLEAVSAALTRGLISPPTAD